MSKNFRKNNPRGRTGKVGFLDGVKKELSTRFEKAEIAALGMLLFVFFLFPLAIFLAGVVAFFGFRYWKQSQKRR